MAEKRRASIEKNSDLIRLLQSIAKSESATICSNLATCEWSVEETNYFLKIIKDYDYFSHSGFDDDQIYAKLSNVMISNGFKKSHADINNYCSELKHKLAHRDSEESNNTNQDNDLIEPETDMVIIKGEDYDQNAAEAQESQQAFYDECDNSKPSRGNRKNNWTYKETECVVQALEKYGMPNRNNVQKVSSVVIERLKQLGFTRTERQVQIKINQLRSLYNQVVQKRLKQDQFPFFNRMKEVLQSNKSSDNEETQSFIPMDDLSRSVEFEEISNSDIQEEDSSIKKARQIWSNKEVKILLRFIEDNNIVTGKQLRKMCNKAMDYLASYGYLRSPTQILIRWKNTKAVYWSTFRKKLVHPERECIFFHQLHNILNPDDKSYETRVLEISDDNELISGNFEIIDPAKLTEGLNFHLSKSSHNPVDTLKDHGVSSQKTCDNFVAVQNSVTSKRFPNTEVVSEPLESTASVEVIPSSPKRSRTEPSQLNSCSSCNTLDSVDHYCISLAHSIKRLDARKQAKLKIEIQQLMYKAEFDSNF